MRTRDCSPEAFGGLAARLRIGVIGMTLRCALARAPLLVFFLLCGCAVGPDFERPRAPATGTFVEQSLPRRTSEAAGDPAGQAQDLRVGNDIARDWWTLFRSEALNRFVVDALHDSPNLAAASAALRQAQEVLSAGRGSLLFPSVNGQLSGTRERVSAAEFGLPGGGSDLSLYNAQVSVSYTFDLFGSVRRQLEALAAQVDYEENQLRAARLALTANIVTSVIREAQLREQVGALREVEKMQRAGLQIVERRFALGAVTRTDVLSQRTALAQTQAAIAPLERQRAQTRHVLAVYAGKTPSELDLGALDISRMELPLVLPVSVASDLVHQRPDILAAESLLHAASAQVGVATANLYPQVTLGGNLGYTSLQAQHLFSPGSQVWGLTAGLAQPIFHGGALQAQRRAAVAAYDQAAAAYRLTVLTAFANVADVLQALDYDAQSRAAQAEADAQARAAPAQAHAHVNAGAGSYLSLLNAQQQFRQSAVALVQARADRFADTAALFQALGGGWWSAAAAPAARSAAGAG